MFTMQLVPSAKADKKATSKTVIAWNVPDAMLAQISSPAYVLLVVVKDGKEIMRYIEELSEGNMTVYLEKAGRYTIHGAVIVPLDSKQLYLEKESDPDRDFRLTCNWLKEKNSGEYSHRTLSLDQEDGPGSQWDMHYYRMPFSYIEGHYEPLVVDISENYFAKKPAPWMWNYVNAFYEVPARDQCEFRRRAIWAFTRRPIVLFFGYILFFVIAFLATFVNPFIVQWKAFKHPLKIGLPDAIHEGEEHGFLMRKDGTRRSKWFNVFRPICLIVLTVVLIYTYRHNAWRELGYLSIACFGITLVFILASKIESGIVKWYKARLQARLEEQLSVSDIERYQHVRDALFSSDIQPSELPVQIVRAVKVASACQLYPKE